MSDFGEVMIHVHSNKNGFGYVEARDERSGKFKFSYRAQPDDIVVIIPYTEAEVEYTDELFLKSFHDWKINPISFVGVVERESRRDPFRIRIREDFLSFFEPSLRCRIFIINTVTTMLREFKMIRSAEFMQLNPQIINPKAPVFSSKCQKIDDFLSAIEQHFNPSQLDAISKAASITSGIVLLQGPPGTGKTHTIRGILSAIIQKEKPNVPHILVCGPSNASVDEIANRIATEKLLDVNGAIKEDIKILRIGNQKKYKADIRENLKKNLRDTPAAVEKITLSAKVSEILKMEDTGYSKIDNLLQDLQNIEKMLIIANKKQEKSKIVALEEKKSSTEKALFREKQSNKSANNKRKEVEIALLNTSEIIFCTLSGAGSKEIKEINHSFDYIIIDEAGQSVELSSLIPFQYGCRAAIMVGDPKQLPATTFNANSAKILYNRSLFERLSTGGTKVEMLTIQYRMINEICRFPSIYFYNNKLETSDDSETICPG